MVGVRVVVGGVSVGVGVVPGSVVVGGVGVGVVVGGVGVGIVPGSVVVGAGGDVVGFTKGVGVNPVGLGLTTGIVSSWVVYTEDEKSIRFTCVLLRWVASKGGLFGALEPEEMKSMVSSFSFIEIMEEIAMICYPYKLKVKQNKQT